MAGATSDPQPGERALHRSSRLGLTAAVVAVFLILALAVPWVEDRVSPSTKTDGEKLELDSAAAVSPGGGWTILEAQSGVELGRDGVRVLVRDGRFDGSASQLMEAVRSQVQDDTELVMSKDSTETSTSSGLKGQEADLSGGGSVGSVHTFVGDSTIPGALPGTVPAVAVVAWGPKEEMKDASSDIGTIVDSVELRSGGTSR